LTQISLSISIISSVSQRRLTLFMRALEGCNSIHGCCSNGDGSNTMDGLGMGSSFTGGWNLMFSCVQSMMTTMGVHVSDCTSTVIEKRRGLPSI
jgi:hypothetical protein